MNEAQAVSEKFCLENLDNKDDFTTDSVLAFQNNVTELQQHTPEGNVSTETLRIGDSALFAEKKFFNHSKVHSFPELSTHICSEGCKNNNKPSWECFETAQANFQNSTNLQKKQVSEYLDLEIPTFRSVKKITGYNSLLNKDKLVSLNKI